MSCLALDPNYIYEENLSPGGGLQQFSYNSTSMDTTDHLLKYRFKHTAKFNVDLRVKNLLSVSVHGTTAISQISTLHLLCWSSLQV